MKFVSIVIMFLGISCFSQSINSNKFLIPYRAGTLWGLSDTLGHIKVKPFAKEISDFSISKNGDGKYVIKNVNKKISVINHQKKIIMPETLEYDSVFVNADYTDIAIFKNGKQGIYKNAKELIPPLYDRVFINENGSYIVLKDRMQGLVNSKGKLIIPVEYKYISASDEKIDLEHKNFVWIAEGAFTTKKFYDEKIQSTTNYSNMIQQGIPSTMIYDGEERSKKEEKIKRELLKIYDDVIFDSYDLENAVVKKSGKLGYYDILLQKEVLPTLFDTVKSVGLDHEASVFLVSQNKKFGMVKEGNTPFVPLEYDRIEDLHYQAYVLKKNNRVGLVLFNTVYPRVEPKYKSIEKKMGIPVNNNWQFTIYVVVCEDGEKGLIGENGVEFFKN